MKYSLQDDRIFIFTLAAYFCRSFLLPAFASWVHRTKIVERKQQCMQPNNGGISTEYRHARSVSLFKQREARKQHNNMFCCSYTWTQSSIYHEYIFQLLQYRIIITACEEVLISVLHGCKRKHRLSMCLNNKGVFPAACNDWMSHWPLMMSPLCSPLADKQNAVMLAAQHFVWQLQEGWYRSRRYAPLEHLLTPQRNLQYALD